MTDLEQKSQKRPFFSIVIPVWNRADCIGRCLESIFNQDFDDYEIIAVDDGSDDKSVAIMKSYTDSRLKIIEHKENRGVCAARHTGTSIAKGQWVVSLDTDWALMPGALAFLADKAKQVQADVGVIGGCARSDKGELWPSKLLSEEPFGLVEFLKWKDTTGATDFMPCRRKQVFETVTWPTDRRLEIGFHLKVAKRWKYQVFHKILATAYTDSPNTTTTDTSSRGRSNKLRQAPFIAQDYDEIMEEFGKELKKHTPNLYWNLLLTGSRQHFLANHRIKGMRYTFAALARKPWALDLLAIAILGLFGGRVMVGAARIKCLRNAFSYLNKYIR